MRFNWLVWDRDEMEFIAGFAYQVDAEIYVDTISTNVSLSRYRIVKEGSY